MAKVVVYGASDDLIEVDGDIREEFTALTDTYEQQVDTSLLGFSDGTLLEVTYGDSGIWRINALVRGDADYVKEEALGDEGKREDGTPAYSDRVTLVSDLLNRDTGWVVHGKSWAKPERKDG